VGVSESDIGIISPYNLQVRLLKELLQKSSYAETEVNTVDQFQGRDKSIIILSFVKTNATEIGVSLS